MLIPNLVEAFQSNYKSQLDTQHFIVTLITISNNAKYIVISREPVRIQRWPFRSSHILGSPLDRWEF